MLLAFAGVSCNRSIDATTGEENGADANREVKARPGSKVKVPSANYDFGTMEAGETGRHTFKIISVGEEPLEIKRGKTTCKCTVSGLSAGGRKAGEKESLILKKGESATIELEWEAKGDQPMFQQSATVHTSDPDHPQIPLSIAGQVSAVMMLQPPEVWHVGAVDGDKPSKFDQFLIGSAILKEFKIIPPIACADESIKAEATPLSKDELKSSRFKSGYKITVTVLPKDAIGRFQEKLTIKTDARKELTFAPQIVGVRTGPVLIRAPLGVRWDGGSMRLSLDRFQASQGKSAELLLYVAGLGDRELEIARIKKDSEILKVELKKLDDPDAKPPAKGKAADPGRRKIYRLVFSVPPGQEPGVRTGSQAVSVKLHTNHKRMKTMTLSVSYNSF
jgi:hypothetical protein